jgi:DHA1 family bicyclomycin/chloramphenicol resistance-like MFS transporter
MITISGTLAMHMFVPALPDAAQSFGVGSAAVQATIGIYILGLAFGQLVYGPLSDALGRRPMLLLGLALYTVAGVVALCAPSAHALIVARLFQALGGCAGLALGRAMVRDTSGPTDAMRALALLNLMMMLGPGLSPLLGAGLVTLGGWRMVFAVLSAAGALTLVLTWRLVPETGQPTGRVSVSVLAHDYFDLLRNRAFMGYAMGGGCATTANYAFVAAAPFIIVEQLRRPVVDVGLALALVTVGMAVGNALTRWLALRVPSTRLLVCGNALSMVCALVFLVMECTVGVSFPAMVATMFAFVVGSGLASPAALAKTLAVPAHQVGAAAGVYGFAQMAIGAGVTVLVGWGGNPALAAATVLTVAAACGQGFVQWALWNERRSAAAQQNSV